MSTKSKKVYNLAQPDMDVMLELKDTLNAYAITPSNETEQHSTNETIEEINNYKESILNFTENNIVKAKKSHLLATEIFKEAKELSHLKVTVAAVPKGILPSEYSVALYDVKVAGYGPDEKIYRKHKWIREHVTRGMTFLELTGKEKYFDFAIYANKKFTGGIGDEDDYEPESNDVWREFCFQPPEEATQVICMTKLNGEAGHFTVRYIGGEFYIIAGSKNVHLLYKDYEDIDKYTESRYLVAKTVAKAVLDAFNSMEEGKLACLKHFLNATKITVVCELLQPHYQHIVDLSYLDQSIVNVVMLAPVAAEDEDSFTAMPPHVVMAFGKALGLSTPEYESLSVSEVQENIVKFRGKKNSEGYVLYYVHGDRTIGLAKVKTCWYVLLRALREKVDFTFNANQKKKLTFTLEERIKATLKRFKEIQKWIRFSDGNLVMWEKLAKSFILWLDGEIKTGRICSKIIRPKFPCIWRDFLQKTNASDEFEYEIQS